MNRKKELTVIVAVILCMLSTQACGQEKEAPLPEAETREENTVPETAAQTKEPDSEEEFRKKDGNLYSYMEEEKEEFKAADGTVLAVISRKIPKVNITYNEEAAAAINKYIEEYVPQGENTDEVKEYAESDYKNSGVGSFIAYAVDTTYKGVRLDHDVISFVIDAYSYAGGAHPNVIQTALNFSTQSGKRLTLSDVTENEEKARTEILAEILEQTKRDEYKGRFYEDYEKNLPDILTEDTWYLGNDGFHVIGNTYLIAPHAGGMFDFVIPYEEAGFLKEEYKIIQKNNAGINENK